MLPASRRLARLPALSLLLLAVACGGKSAPPPSPPGPLGDGTSAWQLFVPGDYVADLLTVAYPNLLAGERLMVLLLNAGGEDRSAATVGVVGTGLPELAPVTPGAPSLGTAAPALGGSLDRTGAQGGEALVTALREETARRRRDGQLQRVVPAAAAPAMGAASAALATLPPARSFCQLRFTDTGTTPYWLPATLAYQTANAAFYYTDEVKAGVDTAIASRAADPTLPVGVTPFWGELGAAFEARVFPALTSYFGAPSDVDGNGKVVFLLANLGKQGQAFPMGYFWDGDIDLPLVVDATTCAGGSSGNQTDMLYLMDPANFATLSGATGAFYASGIKSLVETSYPGVMAHELQHDVNYITRCPTGARCGVAEEIWLNEGLSMLSETVAGYGLHDAGGRADIRYYQGEPTTGLPYHRAYSLTIWEASPYGNYAGVQAYMQYLLDHASPAMSKALENPLLAGKANVEAATGLPWEVGFARFVTAAVFSNEDQAELHGGVGLITSAGNQLAQPAFNFIGDGVTPDYVPWHHYTGSCTIGGVKYPKPRLAYVATVPLAASSMVTLRRDGWTALATGPSAGGPATITVRSASSLKPHVAVVKYSGALPSYTPADTTCP
jgi:hypothetical protein